MHLVSCKIMLGGDNGQIVHRQAHNPVSWPEVGVLQFIHGEESVFDVEVVGETEASRAGEKKRLSEKYGREIVELLYPGKSPMLEMDMPGVTSVPKPKKQKAVKTVPVTPVVEARDVRPAPVPAAEPFRDGD